MWSGNSKVYLPPTQPVPRVYSTDEYVRPSNYYYYCQTDRLIQIGHPYYNVVDESGKTVVQKCSGNQYRAFRLRLPDPNKFAFGDPNFYNPEKSRLVWQLVAIDIGRGGPLGIGTTGHPLFNKVKDTENPGNAYLKTDTADERQNTSFDPKQVQIFVVGSVPCMGSHWVAAKSCVNEHDITKGKCPPLELKNSYIEDGDMGEIGLGNMDFKTLQADKSSCPLELCGTVSKYPDFMKMQSDITGDALWFFGKKESLYCRHMFVKGGKVGEAAPSEVELGDYYLPSENGEDRRSHSSPVYQAIPSGSLNSSDGQLFNRAYFLRRAQGANNGICWNHEFFVTVMDNTRNTNMIINVPVDGNKLETYNATKINQFSRHVEMYEIQFVLRIGIIDLDPTVISQINATHPQVVEAWNLGYVPLPSNTTEDTYRYLDSLATKCAQNVPQEKKDLYEGLKFWDVDCTERLTMELENYPLGRKYLMQLNYRMARTNNGKRKRTSVKSTSKKRRTK